MTSPILATNIKGNGTSKVCDRVQSPPEVSSRMGDGSCVNFFE